MKTMTLTKMMVALGALVLASQTPLAMAQVVEPEKGVRCDAQKQVCRDRNGPSVELTRKYYGDQAAQRLQRYLSGNTGSQQPQQPRPPQQPQQPYPPQQPQQPRPPQQPQQPGYPTGGGQQSGDVFSPGAGVRCVRSQEVCYDASGRPSYGYTSRYFGAGAAIRLNEMRQ